MRDFALKDFQAAGIVGNLGRESAGFTQLREIGAGARVSELVPSQRVGLDV